MPAPLAVQAGRILERGGSQDKHPRVCKHALRGAVPLTSLVLVVDVFRHVGIKGPLADETGNELGVLLRDRGVADADRHVAGEVEAARDRIIGEWINCHGDQRVLAALPCSMNFAQVIR
ncbi:hypothetical protein ES703_32913 [subsurface metagenome]